MQELELAALESLSDYIIETSARAMRQAIAALPDGQWRHTMRIDGNGAPVDLVATPRITGSPMCVDSARPPAVVPSGLHSTHLPPHAYSLLPLQRLTTPTPPHLPVLGPSGGKRVQLRADGAVVDHGGGAGAVHHMNQHAAALAVPQELVAQAHAGVCALQQAGHVCSTAGQGRGRVVESRG